MDLLLHLIEKRELDITEISLALVADRFLAYVAAMHTVNAGELADFCAVAARLLLIKSRYLLPRPRDEESSEEEEDPAEELARQLCEYKRYKQVAELLKEIEEAGVRCYPRVAPPPHFERPLKPGDNTLDELFSAFRRALKEHPQPGNANHVVAPIQVSMAECITRIESIATHKRPHLFLKLDRASTIAARDHCALFSCSRIDQAATPHCQTGDFFWRGVSGKKRT